MRLLPSLVAAWLVFAALVSAREARAWGVSPPVGPTGLPTLCTGDPPGKAEAAQPPSTRGGASFGAFWTTLRFSGSRDVSLREQAVSASIEHRPRVGLSLSFSAGAVVGGQIGDEAATYAVKPGGVGSLGGSWRVLGEGREPFILFSVSFSGSTVLTERDGVASERARLTSLDARFGVLAGVTLFDRVSPYAVVRAFGGPVWWALPGDTVSGSDIYHYQVGAGLSLSLPLGLDGFVEGVPLGEKRVSAGLGASF